MPRGFGSAPKKAAFWELQWVRDKALGSRVLGLRALEMVDVNTPKEKLLYISEGYAHYSEGLAGDGKWVQCDVGQAW